VKILYRVAVLATILVRRGGELFVVRVLVAIHAGREFHFVYRVFSRGCMAFLTGNYGVFSFERIMRGGVFLHTEFRRLPTVYRMAFRAFAFAGSRLELALVRIRGMAIRALGECHRALEISTGMTTGAIHFEVHAKKWIFRFRMIELYRRHVDLFPVVRRVAGFAGGLEGALMRIGMAVDTGSEFDSCVLYEFLGS
jgi:hypothetical protein